MYLIISFFIVISVGTHQLHISGVGATGVFDWLNGTILCQCRMFVWTRYRTSVHKVAPINLLGPVGVIIELSAFMRRWKAACVWSRNNFVASVWFQMRFTLCYKRFETFTWSIGRKNFTWPIKKCFETFVAASEP